MMKMPAIIMRIAGTSFPSVRELKKPMMES
jgi:uroporphyrinogen-III decarboxylase